MDKKNLFSSGEFAKINGINKSTLHYYSSFQSIQLEMILIFRKLEFSIDDIKAYTNSPSDTSFLQMITEKKETDRPIHRTALRSQIIFAGKTKQTGINWRIFINPSSSSKKRWESRSHLKYALQLSYLFV